MQAEHQQQAATPCPRAVLARVPTSAPVLRKACNFGQKYVANIRNAIVEMQYHHLIQGNVVLSNNEDFEVWLARNQLPSQRSRTAAGKVDDPHPSSAGVFRYFSFQCFDYRY